jgi:hypothetical protein
MVVSTDAPRRLALSMSAYKGRWRRAPPPEGTYIFRCDSTEEQFIYTGYFVEGRRRAIQWARHHGASYVYVRP